MSKYTDVMIDIETVGRIPGCPVIQIAAVPFNINTGEISKNVFSKSLNRDYQEKRGCVSDKNTISWWLKTNKDLFNYLQNSKNNPITVAKEFQEWYNSLKNSENLRIWGNSNRFDLGILEGFYQIMIDPSKKKVFQPFWNTWLERDVRTLSSLVPEIKTGLKFVGEKHNAIDDCKHQIKYCHLTMKHLKLI